MLSTTMCFLPLEKGSYLYFNGNSIEDVDVGNAEVFSSPLNTNGMLSPFCLSFAYSLSGGRHVPFLFVYTAIGGDKKPPIWQASFSQSWKWQQANVQLNIQDQSRVNHLHKLHYFFHNLIFVSCVNFYVNNY